MILYLASFIIFIFISLNLFFRADCPLILKLAGCALVLLASLKYPVYQFVGGAFFSPHLPRPFILIYEALYGALIILFVLLVIWDIYLAGNWLLSRVGIPTPTHLPHGLIKCALVLLALGAGAWGTWQSVKVPDAREVELSLPNLPTELEGFRIVQLTDLHIGPLLKKNWLEEVVAKTNALDPDLVALTGDYIDGYVNEIARELRPLQKLRSKYGVWGVTGNHEYYWSAKEWLAELEKLQINMLENAHEILDVNGQPLVVAGIPDLAAQRFGLAAPDLQKALAGAPEAVRILLSHQPKNFPLNLEKVDVQLSGHTHGGLMFFLRPLVAKFNNGFVVGEYDLGGKKVYVSPGTGLWNGFSCRIGNPSEITLLILKNAPDKTRDNT